MIQHTLSSTDRTLVLSFPGDLLSTNAEKVRAEIFTLFASVPVKSSNWETLKLELTAAKMIDSVGLNLIVGLYKEAKKRNGKTVVVISNPNVQRTFLITRLDSHIQIILASEQTPA